MFAVDYLCTNGDSYNMIDPLVDSCVPCEVGTFQPTGIRLGCMKCAAGFSTLQNTSYGNEWDLCYRKCLINMILVPSQVINIYAKCVKSSQCLCISSLVLICMYAYLMHVCICMFVCLCRAVCMYAIMCVDKLR